MRIVVIGGLPCSGKSTLATRLRARCSLPVLCKDETKEALFDRLGSGDRAWSKRLSLAAYDIMFAQAEELLRCGGGCIVEGNFRAHEHRERFARLQTAGAAFLQVFCHAQPAVLISRFHERAHSGRRHAGHVDVASLQEIENEIASASQQPLPLAGSVIDCDTTHDWQTAIDAAVEQVLTELNAAGARGSKETP